MMRSSTAGYAGSRLPPPLPSPTDHQSSLQFVSLPSRSPSASPESTALSASPPRTGAASAPPPLPPFSLDTQRPVTTAGSSSSPVSHKRYLPSRDSVICTAAVLLILSLLIVIVIVVLYGVRAGPWATAAQQSMRSVQLLPSSSTGIGSGATDIASTSDSSSGVFSTLAAYGGSSSSGGRSSTTTRQVSSRTAGISSSSSRSVSSSVTSPVSPPLSGNVTLVGEYLGPGFFLATASPFTMLNANLTSSLAFYCDATAGSDSNTGRTPSSPLQSLQKLQTAIRAATASHPGTAALAFLSGTFYLNETWSLSSLDSNTANSFTVYTSLDSTSPAVISGGRLLPSNWTLFNSSLNIWSLYVGSLSFRNLWVNNTRIDRARNINWPYRTGPNMQPNYTLGENVLLNGNIDCRVCSLPNVAVSDPYQAEAVMVQEWQVARCPVTIFPNNQSLTIAPACGQNIQFDVFAGLTWLEDALPFLITPNSWVSNREGSGYIYMIPPVGLSLNQAIVVAGVLQQIVSMVNVSNVAFSGVEFSHSDWPAATTQGLSVLQADLLSLSAAWSGSFGHLATVTVPYLYSPEDSIIPAALYCFNCSNTAFTRCHFHHMSAAGLRYAEQSNNNLVWYNSFNDIAAAALQVGTFSLDNKSRVSNTMIQDNSVLDVAVEFLASAAVFELWAVNSVYDHNWITNVPYSGLSVSLGWDLSTVANTGGTVISSNHVENVMQVLADGGCIYTNAARDVLMTRNWCHDAWSGYEYLSLFGYTNTKGLYIDQGTNGATIAGDNVVAFIFSGSEPMDHDGNNITGLAPPAGFNSTAVTSAAGPRFPPLYLISTQIGFGGMFSVSAGFNNSLALGQFACPAGFSTQAVYGVYNLTQTIQFCYEWVKQGSTPQFTFGGLYSSTLSNPFSGTFGCSSGFTANQLLPGMFWCYRVYQAEDSVNKVGGFFSVGSQLFNGGVDIIPYNNAITMQQTCPAGFETHIPISEPALYYCMTA